MQIVEVTGGLGNQMFQYAFGKYLKKKNPNQEIKYDLGYYDQDNSIRKYSLEEAFGISVPRALKREIRAIRGYYQYDNRFVRCINTAMKKNKSISYEVIEDLDKGFEGNPIDVSNSSYYSGYWQSEKYFRSFRDEIISDFSFRNDNASDEMIKLCDEIENTMSISLHIRLEDYLQGNNYKVYGDICTSEYYNKAISKMVESNPDAIFYLFTTDEKKAKEILPDNVNYRIVKYSGQRDYLDMYIMSKCKHYIIANSTFSWWGAWLNNNPNKKILCPPKWLNNHEIYNQYCEGWEIII